MGLAISAAPPLCQCSYFGAVWRPSATPLIIVAFIARNTLSIRSFSILCERVELMVVVVGSNNSVKSDGLSITFFGVKLGPPFQLHFVLMKMELHCIT
jgi:hypothetical protein